MKQPSARQLSFIVCALATACGGAPKEAAPVKRLSAADEITRIATEWMSVVPAQGLLSPPSKISTFKNSRASKIVLGAHSATETLTIEEKLQLRTGERVSCSTQVQLELRVRYGRRGGEAAVELTRPPLTVPRSCQGFHPEGSLNEPERSALFVLRADTLVALEPPLEKRKYLPGTK